MSHSLHGMANAVAVDFGEATTRENICFYY
jgi:hypothetical protein